jgi:hypothetical protein
MGIRPSGGGFLNNVDVTWVDYKWSAKAFEDGNVSYDLEAHLLVDGTEEPIKKWLKLGTGKVSGEGFGDGSNISEDGKKLYTTQRPWSSFPVALFLRSMMDAGYKGGFAEDDNDEYLSLENFVAGRPRFHVFNEVNVQKTADFGKVKDKKTGEAKYDRTDFKVEKFYGFTRTAEGGKKASNGSGKEIEAKSDLKPVAQETLIAVLKQAPGQKMDLAKIRQRATLKLAGKPNRDEVVKLVESMATLPSSKWVHDTETGIVELIPF